MILDTEIIIKDSNAKMVLLLWEKKKRNEEKYANHRKSHDVASVLVIFFLFVR